MVDGCEFVAATAGFTNESGLEVLLSSESMLIVSAS